MKCPKCEIHLIVKEIVDHGYANGDNKGFWVDVEGYCEKCQKGFLFL